MKRAAIAALVILGLAPAWAEEPAKAPSSTEIDPDAVFELGKELFDTFAPPEVKEEFEFPDRAQWDDFVGRLQGALAGEDPAALAGLETEARTALATLRALPGAENYVDWLQERMDYIEAAKEMTPATPPKLPTKPSVQFIPEYNLWLKRLKGRAPPASADEFVPQLRPVFATAGVPGDLVWLAEVESGFNPKARSPVGARGLYQLMPATAKELGLSTFLPDERTDPDKSASAAARLLARLHQRFKDWPLALAAYNAGAGRIQRTLAKRNAKTFAEIAPSLPVETRLYVPKVLAVVQVRAGVTLHASATR